MIFIVFYLQKFHFFFSFSPRLLVYFGGLLDFSWNILAVDFSHFSLEGQHVLMLIHEFLLFLSAEPVVFLKLES